MTSPAISEETKKWILAFSHTIASAIEKNPSYYNGHCHGVVRTALMLSKAAADSNKFSYNPDENELLMLEIATWLHDCGKLMIPSYILDKSTKLHLFFDRIELIEAKFEIILRDLEIEKLKAENKKSLIDSNLERNFDKKVSDALADLDFIKTINKRKDKISDTDIQRINYIAESSFYQKTSPSNKQVQLFNEIELQNLSIRSGTLNSEERSIIEQHVTFSMQMIEQLPLPNNMKDIAEYAGRHHEKMDGSGYPGKLTSDQIPIQSKIIAIADIFEALLSRGRPYKEAYLLSETLDILYDMQAKNLIDSNLFKLFIEKKIYLNYANKYLPAEQIDEVDEQKYLNNEVAAA